MIPDETKRQIVYNRLRKLTGDRIARAVGLADEDLVNLSLSQLINLLFLIHGDGGSTGNGDVPCVRAALSPQRLHDPRLWILTRG